MSNSRKKQAGLVYSTRHGKMCPKCAQTVAACTCRNSSANAIPVGDGIVRVSRQTKGRKGKGVTLITGIPLGRVELAELAKELKQKCGSGGTVRDGVIEIQGDRRDDLVAELEKRGFKVKKAGG